MVRVILHVDMDAFFAAVEQREHPHLKEKPVIVGADPKEGKGRGVVSTCSYEARVYGIHSAMPISQAYRRCPHGIFIPPNGKLYQQISTEIQEILYRFTDLVEPVSIDEAFLDVTGSVRMFGDGEAIAHKIKDAIRSEQQLTASVGVAPNKYLAKIASDLNKPDGLVVVAPDQVGSFLHPLPIARLWGAGQRTQQSLQAMGIRTIGDLAQFPPETLRKKLGKSGEHFYNLAHGIDKREVSVESKVKSISNEHTFGNDIYDKNRIYNTLFLLADKVGYRLRKQKLKGRTIHLKLRYDNFDTVTRNKTVTSATDSTRTIYQTVKKLFDQNYMSPRKVRLLGVGISGFQMPEGRQLSLFDERHNRDDALNRLEDLLIDRFGNAVIARAESIGLRKSRPSDKDDEAS